MKRLMIIAFAIAAISFWGCAVSTRTVMVVHHPYPTFDNLDNYGEWIDVPGLGTVWRPYDETNWQPYADGHWVWTDDGWMWVSNEPYGWVVYHYGYWHYTNRFGWIWIPGYDWQPARVVWYNYGGYIGWAPLPPPQYRAPYYTTDPINKIWIIVPERNFVDHDIVKYRTRSVSPDIQVLRSRDGGRAPDVRNIERASNQNINPVRPVREEVTAGGRKIIRVRVDDRRPANPPTRTEPPRVLPVRPPTETVPPQRQEPGNKINQPKPEDRSRSGQNETIRNNGRTNEQGVQPDRNAIRNKDAKRKEPVKKQDVKKREEVKKQQPADKKKESRKVSNEKRKENGRENKDRIR